MTLLNLKNFLTLFTNFFILQFLHTKDNDCIIFIFVILDIKDLIISIRWYSNSVNSLITIISTIFPPILIILIISYLLIFFIKDIFLNHFFILKRIFYIKLQFFSYIKIFIMSSIVIHIFSFPKINNKILIILRTLFQKYVNSFYLYDKLFYR